MSVVAQKIKGAGFNLDAYPHLQEMVSYLDEVVSVAIEATCRTHELPQSLHAQISDRAGVAGGIVYSFKSNDPAGVIAVAVSPQFLAALSECLLGAEFDAPEEAAPGPMEIRLAEAFIIDLVQPLDHWLANNAPKYTGVKHNFSSAVSDAKEIEKALPGCDYFEISVEIKPQAERKVKALSFLLPAAMIEDMGLMDKPRPQKAEAGNVEWRAMMLKHIHASEIEVDVIMDRYTARLSDMAELEVGQIVPLEGEPHKKLKLYLKTQTGPVMIGHGKLGAYKKKKAVKLTSDLGAAEPSEK